MIAQQEPADVNYFQYNEALEAFEVQGLATTNFIRTDNPDDCDYTYPEDRCTVIDF